MNGCYSMDNWCWTTNCQTFQITHLWSWRWKWLHSALKLHSGSLLCKEVGLVGSKIENLNVFGKSWRSWNLILPSWTIQITKKIHHLRNTLQLYAAETLFTVYWCYSTGRKGSFDPTREMEQYKGELPKKKSRSMWIKLGDSNTKYFAAIMKERHHKKQIIKLTSANGEKICGSGWNSKWDYNILQFFNGNCSSKQLQSVRVFWSRGQHWINLNKWPCV